MLVKSKSKSSDTGKAEASAHKRFRYSIHQERLLYIGCRSAMAALTVAYLIITQSQNYLYSQSCVLALYTNSLCG